MATLKQIEANRRNARLSTGPKTSQGRFRSSLNATKHGAYSKKLLTPDENDADLARLERMYVAHYLWVAKNQWRRRLGQYAGTANLELRWRRMKYRCRPE